MPELVLTPPTTGVESLVFDISYTHYMQSLGPSLYWALDSANGLTDLSGNGYDGTASGGPTIGGSGGPTGIDGSTDLDGSNDYISSTYSPFVNGTTRSFTGWAYRDASATGDQIMGSDASSNIVQLALATGGTGVTWDADNAAGGGNVVWASAWPGNGVWVHWALIISDVANTASLYLNGALVSTQAWTEAFGASPGNFKIGAVGTSTSGAFDGKQAQVAVFERALTSVEIANLASPTNYGSLDVTNHTDYWVESFEYTPAKPKTEWIESADTDGALPAAEDHYTNAEATMRIRVAPQLTRDAAIDLINAVVEKGQKARRMVTAGQPGLPVEWTPKDSLRVGTLYLIEADDWNTVLTSTDDPGYANNFPVFTVHLTFAPFIYMPAISTDAATVNEPSEVVTLDVEGQVQTPGTLTLTDTATQNRKTIAYGLETGYESAADTYYHGAELVAAGRTSVVTDSDAYSNTATKQLHTVLSSWSDFFTISDLPHRGPYRVIVRAKATTDEEEVSLRLLWRVGDGAWIANTAAVVAALTPAAFVEVDLGTVDVPVGTANLDVLVQASADPTTGSSEGVHGDVAYFMPAERYGVVQGETISTSGQTVSAYDAFDHDSGGTITGTTADIGSTWAGAGDSDDFTLASGAAVRYPSAADADLNTGRYVTIASAEDDQTVTAGFQLLGNKLAKTKETRFGVVARYVDTSNYLLAAVRIRKKQSGNYQKHVTLYKRVAGTVTKLGEVSASDTALVTQTATGSWVSGVIQLSVTAAGVATVRTGNEEQDLAVTKTAFSVTDGDLDPSSTLDDGKAGFYHTTDDADYGAITVYTFSASATTPTVTETYAVPSGGVLTLTGSEASNTTPVAVRGAAFMLEPGDTTRIALRTRRNAEGEADTGLTDTSSAVVSYRPAYLSLPGA